MVKKQYPLSDKKPSIQAPCYSYKKKVLSVFFSGLFLYGSAVWAGDIASYVDLGFSQDGKIYMFAQYGVQGGTLKPWADISIVDVPKNEFVSGGRVSFVHTLPVIAGQDGSGALYRLIANNAPLAERYGVSFLLQGQVLYVALDGDISSAALGEIIEFRDFGSKYYYRAQLFPIIEGTGTNVTSSFYIALEQTTGEGARKNYPRIGNPQIKRPLITSYRIKKVMIAPRDGSIIFVIEMRKQGPDGVDIRYMVEALRL
jgi:predicted secreted protein